MIYTDQQINENWLYGEVMAEINDLYEEFGEPQEFDGTPKSTTTGNQRGPFWNPHEIGDWDGDEDIVADRANELLNEVYAGISVYGNGGIYHYYRSEEFSEFQDQAEELIDEFHARDAYNRLCDSWETEEG